MNNLLTKALSAPRGSVAQKFAANEIAQKFNEQEERIKALENFLLSEEGDK